MPQLSIGSDFILTHSEQKANTISAFRSRAGPGSTERVIILVCFASTVRRFISMAQLDLQVWINLKILLFSTVLTRRSSLLTSPRRPQPRRRRVDCGFKQFYVILHQIPVALEPLQMLLSIPQSPEICGPDGDPTPHVYYGVKLQLSFASNHVSTPLRDGCANRRHSCIRESCIVPRGHSF